MAKSQHMASSFFPEKSSGSPAFISVDLDMRAAFVGHSGAGLKDSSSSSLVISMSGSWMGSGVGLGRVEIVMGRGSSAAGNSHHGVTCRSLQGLCILLSPLSLDGLPVPC